jgi:hypothetical protein
MGKNLSPKKKLELLGPFWHGIRTSPKRTSSGKSNEKKARYIAEIVEVLDRAEDTAFKTMKLDPNNENDRKQLLVWLAWSVFGGRGPGAPPKWSAEELQQLLQDVNAMRAADPKLTESRCCELLSKGKAANGRYEGKKSSTLRRVLQKAKALERTAEAVVTARQRGAPARRHG